MKILSENEYVQFITDWKKEERIYKIHLHDENKHFLGTFRLSPNSYILQVFEELSKPVGYSSEFLKKHFKNHFFKTYHFDGSISHRHVTDEGVIETALYV